MRIVLIGLSLALCKLAGVAVAEDDLTNCHGISGDATRLLCYDNMTGYEPEEMDQPAAIAPAEEAIPTEARGAQWRYSEERSALDNRKDVWLSVTSRNTEGNSIGTPTRAWLWVRCMNNRTNVFIGFNRYTSDSQNVRYRFDDGPIQNQWMDPLRGGEGIGIWSGGRAIPFIRQMFGKEELVVAYDTFSGPVEFVFDVAGLRARVDPLANACEWSP